MVIRVERRNNMKADLKEAAKFYAQVFAGAVLAAFMASGNDVFNISVEDVKLFVSAGIGSVLPLIYKALDPKDSSFGRYRK